ncbi:cytochrome c biogenesis protein CcsA [Kamptonema cortianum]|nr:cytochrome c biogenesis protein CcsA [Kamptonema cortianum]
MTEAFDQMRQSFAGSNPVSFAESSAQFARVVGALNPGVTLSPGLVKVENFYESLHPFRWAWIAFLGGFVSLLAVPNKPRGYKIAWGLVWIGFVFQLSGFVMRVIISQRAPVTNMYETVIWLAFGVTIFAMIFEWKYKCRYYLLGALPVAILSLLLADSLPGALDNSIRPLMPVLQHNFWLTVHVLTITSSYAAFALALGVAHIILGKVLFTRTVKIEASLYNYLYKTLQIGVLLLAIGTVLGAVWANYSWGRFWDWDPKETWALIAFLSYLFVLHGRIAGWWGGFGLAVGSVIGFLAVLMAWYGVNFVLGVGLHSYGFGAGGVEYAAAFAVLELLFTGAALAVYLRLNKQNAPEKGAAA